MTSIQRLCLVVLACWLSVWALPAAQAAQETVSAQTVLDAIKATLHPDGSVRPEDEVYFEDVEIQGALDLTTLADEGADVITITAPIYIMNVTFTGAVTASLDNHEKTVTVHFDGGVNFRGTTFQEDADFSGASFAGSNFDSVHFMKSVGFQQTQFSTGASFRQTIFGQSSASAFDDDPCTVNSPESMVNFASAVFDTPVDFSEAIVCQPSFFTSGQFLQDARFVNMKFGSNIAPLDFTNVYFGGSAVFQASQFPLNTAFTGAQFNNEVDFSSVKFGQEVSFNGATFNGQTSFHESQFNTARFAKAIFNKMADFSSTFFNQEVNFKQSDFKDRAVFRDAQFGAVSLEGATFESELDLNNVKINGALDFRSADYATLEAREFDFDALNRWKDQFPLSGNTNASSANDHLVAILARLENKFRSQNQLELSNEAFYKRKVLEREQLNVLDGLFASVADLVFGYGVIAWRVVATAMVLIIFFACFYCWEDTLREIERDGSKKRGLRLIDIPVVFEDKMSTIDNATVRKSRLPGRFMTGIGFSFGVFTKLNLVNKACHHKWIKWIVILEWGLSVALLAGLIFTLSNTNYLLHGMLKAFVH